MFSMMFHSSQLVSECNSLCRFWSIKFSVIWVLGLGKILRRAFDCLGHLWHLNVFSNWDKALWADSLHPWDMSFLHPWDMSYLISLVLRDLVLWFCCFFFLTEFVGSVKVAWNKLDNPSKPGSSQKGWNAEVLLNFWSEFVLLLWDFFFFFLHVTVHHWVTFCFAFLHFLAICEELGRMPLRWSLSTSQWFGSQVTNLEGNVPFYLFVTSI